MSKSNSPVHFKQRLQSGEALIGTFLKTPSMMTTEVLSRTELDVVCLDAEHAPFDRADIDRCLLPLRHAGMASLVRVQSAAPEQILNALDCGATGVVVPHVDSVEKARACAAAAKYGDRGRGYAGSTRAAGYASNSIAQNLSLNADETVVVAQIEDLAALGCIDEIAQVEGIDCLFIGMMDLTVALGAAAADDPRVVEAAEKICCAAREANRRIGIFVPTIDEVAFWRQRGVSLFLMASEHTFLKQGAAKQGSEVRKQFEQVQEI